MDFGIFADLDYDDDSDSNSNPDKNKERIKEYPEEHANRAHIKAIMGKPILNAEENDTCSHQQLSKYAKEVQEKLRKDLPDLLDPKHDTSENSASYDILKDFRPAPEVPKNPQNQYNQNRNNQSFLTAIHNLLTPQECEAYIQACNEAGFGSIKEEYDPNYRSSTRLTSFSDQFATTIWSRLSQHFKDDDMSKLQPYGFMVNGTWVPIGINPCIRFTKYQIGDKFDKHRDGKYVKNDDLQSILSVMIYLNDDYFGGHTSFELNTHSKVSVIPLAGLAVVFNHEMLHTGTSVTVAPSTTMYGSTYPKGYYRSPGYKELIKKYKQDPSQFSNKRNIKYIVRMDVMFQRIDDFYLDRTYVSNPQYQLAERLYWQSVQLQREGKPDQSTQAYLEAQDIQYKYFMKETKLQEIEDRNVNNHIRFPDHIATKIFGQYTDLKTLQTCMATCRAWKEQIDRNVVWRKQYLKRWPIVSVKFIDERVLNHIINSESDNSFLEAIKKDNKELREQINSENNSDNNSENNSDTSSWIERHSALLPMSVTINWKKAYQYRLDADKKFRASVMLIDKDYTFYKGWDHPVANFPTVIRYSCGHMWCAGSGSENCLVGHRAIFSKEKEERNKADGFFDENIIGLYTEPYEDNSRYDLNLTDEGHKINWIVVRAIIKDIISTPEIRINDVEQIYDDVHHKWTEFSRKRHPLIIIRMPWMTDKIVKHIYDFTIKEIQFPYVWVLDQNQLKELATQQNTTDTTLENIISNMDLEDDNTINRNMQQIWELSQLPEAKRHFQTIADQVDWSSYF